MQSEDAYVVALQQVRTDQVLRWRGCPLSIMRAIGFRRRGGRLTRVRPAAWPSSTQAK